MTSITVVPAGPRDQAMHAKQFEALRVALEGLGHQATIDIGMERRGIPAVVVVYVALKLADKLTDDALDSIIDRVKRTLRNLRRPESGEIRTAVIFGPDGEVLREVELQDQN